MKRGLVLALVLSFALVLSISFISAGFFMPDFWNKITGHATTASLCGNGVLDPGELCDYAATDSINNPYGKQCSSNCWVNDAAPTWAGCRGSGVHVCTDNPLVTSQYFIDHPGCIAATTCAGQFFNCNGVICPPPTSTTANTTNKTAIPTCTDSDNGANYYMYGKITYTNNPQGILDEYDICSNSTVLTERICVDPSDHSKNFVNYNCPNGCLNGTCISANNGTTTTNGTTITECSVNGSLAGCPTNQTSFCIDTDSGKNIYVKGIVNGKECPNCYPLVQQPDSCAVGNITNGSANYGQAQSCTGSNCYLLEYWPDLSSGYCHDGFLQCQNGCIDGACIGNSLVNYTMQESQKININVNNVIYNIYVAGIYTGTPGNNQVTFFINGSYPHPMFVGDWLSLGNGVYLKVAEINVNPKEVTFFLYENPTKSNQTSSTYYPAPFNNSGVAIVYGAQASSAEKTEAENIVSNLETYPFNQSAPAGTSYFVSDNEFNLNESAASSRNLILVGTASPTISNSIIPQVTGSNSITLNPGQFLIESFRNPFYTTDTRIALVVMGYDEVDLDNAVKYLITTPSVSTSIGSTYIESNGTVQVNSTLSNNNGAETINCQGCFVSGTCYPLEYRTNGQYCSIGLNLVPQAAAGASCNNNFECSSNVCISNQCLSSTFIQSVINWFKNLFGIK